MKRVKLKLIGVGNIFERIEVYSRDTFEFKCKLKNNVVGLQFAFLQFGEDTINQKESLVDFKVYFN